MSDEIQSFIRKSPLQDVVIFVSQQLMSSKMILHQQCIELGGKFVWVFDLPFTHYIYQGKLNKRNKEYKKATEYKALCVHPIWLKVCYKFRQRVAEKLYATTYNPNRSLIFVSTDDEDEENHIPSLTTKKPIPHLNLNHRIIPADNKIESHSITLVSPRTEISSSPKHSSQASNEAETMLNDLQLSLTQFLNNNNSTTSISHRPVADNKRNAKSFSIIPSNNKITNNNVIDIESSMRVEWLDDEMQAERRKIIDEDEYIFNNNQQQSQYEEPNTGLKRPLVDSNLDYSFNAKKCRT